MKDIASVENLLKIKRLGRIPFAQVPDGGEEKDGILDFREEILNKIASYHILSDRIGLFLSN